ncbi:DUF6292 family protein [Actinomadura rudentiformis]|uniref:DUF6292 family protein n=1 Tax=Actinomadura rudentiformis TaxID=359158 RepID=UPI00178C5F23|nr:DUF6292 family protein [Actinomadura rudentiformis]
MSGLSYHRVHEPYIEAVAAAVQAAGVELADWGAETNEPRNGYLEPAAPVGPGPQVEPGGLWLGWTEERGWFYGEVGDDASGQLSYTEDLGGGILPAPDEAATRIALLVQGDAEALAALASERDRENRSFTDENDGFENKLLSYHPLQASYDSVAAYNEQAPRRQLPRHADAIHQIFHNTIDDPDGTEHRLDFAPDGLRAHPDTVGNLVLRPLTGDGPITVLAVNITRKQVNKLIDVKPRPYTLKRLRAETERLALPTPPA